MSKPSNSNGLRGKKKTFISHYRTVGFNVSAACELTPINRSTYYQWLKDCPEFAQAISDAEEELVDLVEGKLQSRINSMDTTAMIFWLKCKAKKRGYVERQEVTGAGGGPMKVELINSFKEEGEEEPDTPPGKPQEQGEDST